ncbi:MAG: mechanosensitive ion channel family protein [Porticoccaceae bacterium]
MPLSPFRDYLPLLITLAIVSAVLWLAHLLLSKRTGLSTAARFPRQLILLGLTVSAIVALILALPTEVSTRNQLLTLLGLVLTAMLTLSSTTFVSNIMAGVMQRSVKSFQPGDFIRVEGWFGRVTERGLFHTEIQTTDRDLVTLPNLYLSVNPVKVTRASGTVISCDVSLGYDVPHHRVEALLLEAASAAGLKEPFVRVLELGDFAIGYQAAGFCTDLSQLLTLQTRLRTQVVDHLHGADIEIVSPHFINQFQLPALGSFTSTAADINARGNNAIVAKPAADERSPEELIFDKADRAGKIESMIRHMDSLSDSIKEAKSGLAKVTNPAEIERINGQISGWDERLKTLAELVENAQEHQNKD